MPNISPKRAFLGPKWANLGAFKANIGPLGPIS